MNSQTTVYLLTAVQEWHRGKTSEFIISEMNEMKDYFVRQLIEEGNMEENEMFKKYLRWIYDIIFYVEKLIPPKGGNNEA